MAAQVNSVGEGQLGADLLGGDVVKQQPGRDGTFLASDGPQRFPCRQVGEVEGELERSAG